MPRVQVGCSGTLNGERALAELDRFELWGNDVSLLPCMLGALATGDHLDVRLADEHLDGPYGWLADWLGDDQAVNTATIMLAFSLVQAGGLTPTNRYHVRQQAAYRSQWERLHAEQVEVFSRAKVIPKLAGFRRADVMDVVAGLEPGTGFVSFPPFFKAGYEKMFQAVDELFRWDQPHYEVFDPSTVTRLADELAARDDPWLLLSGQPIDGHDDHLVGLVELVPTPHFSSTGHGSRPATWPLHRSP